MVGEGTWREQLIEAQPQRGGARAGPKGRRAINWAILVALRREHEGCPGQHYPTHKLHTWPSHTQVSVGTCAGGTWNGGSNLKPSPSHKSPQREGDMVAHPGALSFLRTVNAHHAPG